MSKFQLPQDIPRDTVQGGFASGSGLTTVSTSEAQPIAGDVSMNETASISSIASAAWNQGAQAGLITPQPARRSATPRKLETMMSVHGLKKTYRKGPHKVPVLGGVDLEVGKGEFLSIVGQSGCGKTTLLHLLGTLDKPDEGQIFFEGNRIDNLPSAGRDILRNRHFGMIFQFYHLLPELTTLENVLTPLMVQHSFLSYMAKRGGFRRRATELLEMVGLGHRLRHKPRELSGGEMQRTAIARALISQPDVLLADEPTGNLDKSTGEEIMGILRRLNAERNLTIVMVTHDQAIAESADRNVRLVEGHVVEA